jgi:hypothetical protein
MKSTSALAVLVSSLVLLAGTQAKASQAGAPATEQTVTATIASLDTPSLRSAFVNTERRGAALANARMSTPVAFPLVQTASPAGNGRTSLKGWVLLLMGAFLIISVSQRRYQALSDL